MRGNCTHRTSRCSDARDYRARLRECCRQHVITVTTAVAEAFTEAGITWWADYGTLLGAVRNPLTTWADYPWLPQSDTPIAPGIIPHDKDSDFGAMEDDWKLAVHTLRRLAAKRSFNLVERVNSGSMKMRLSRLNHSNVDIFFWSNDNGTMRRKHYIGVDRFKGRDFPASMIEPMGSVEWEGVTLPAPNDPAVFLAMRYGPNWLTPVMANNDGVPRANHPVVVA